jgi:arylsulfatase A-like enzyme
VKSLVFTVVLVTALSLGCTNDSPPHEPPNVVLIVADDLGYADVGYQGAPADWTPNIDALASQGTVFSDAYAAAPICAPSRAALMTGRHPARYGYLGFTGTIRRGAARGGRSCATVKRSTARAI